MVFGADIAPACGDEDVQIRMVKKSDGKTRGDGEHFKNLAKPVHLHKVPDAILPVDQMIVVPFGHMSPRRFPDVNGLPAVLRLIIALLR